MTALSNPQRRNLAMEIIRYRSRPGGFGMLVNNKWCAIIKRSPELKALIKKKLVVQVRREAMGRKRETYLVPADGITLETAPGCPECGRPLTHFRALMSDSGSVCYHQ